MPIRMFLLEPALQGLGAPPGNMNQLKLSRVKILEVSFFQDGRVDLSGDTLVAFYSSNVVGSTGFDSRNGRLGTGATLLNNSGTLRVLPPLLVTHPNPRTNLSKHRTLQKSYIVEGER